MELVVAMVVIGILAANAIPHLFTASRFEEMGFADATAAAMRYARQLSVASGCDTRIEISPAGFRLWQREVSCDGGPFSRAVVRPGGGVWADAAPNGVAVGSLDVFFDPAGQPYAHSGSTLLTTPQTVAVGTRSILLEPTTGYVH